jgi:succinoglycan biosynthesis protein ExoO
MHDLLSSHYPSVDADEEFSLLAKAGLVVAIQQEEARAVQSRLPEQAVIVTPMALDPVKQAEPGDDQRLLFVGSQTGPNIEALTWFVREAWPLLRAEHPDLVIEVAGTVSRGMGAVPEGVRLLGLVDDLEGLYRAAGVVVSPLRSGTGLKIKLIEALSRGKAMVVTSVTTQGVEDLVGPAVRVADDPRAFAKHVLELLGDKEARKRAGEAGLHVVSGNFAPESCYRDLYAFLASGTVSSAATPSDREVPVNLG